MNKPLTIVVATDSHYAVLGGALIKSIEATIRPNQKVEMYVIDDGIMNSQKERFIKSANPEITTLHFRPIKEVVPKGVELPIDKTSYPISIYMRLFIPDIVPSDVEKALFMDVDMIVEHDITTLFETDLGDNIVGAVRDPRITQFDNSWGGVKNYQELGLAGDTHYFNAGLMLIDVAKWKAGKIGVKTVDCITKYRDFANYPDQYGLNIILANRWLALDERWNYFSCYNEKKPFLIHYTGRKPIYQSYDNHPEYLLLFNKYLEQSGWKGFKPISETARYMKKIWNIVEKVKRAIF